MAISEINDKSLAASAVTATKLATSAVDLTSNKVTGILPAANVPAEVKNINPNIFINGNFDVWQRSTSYTENQGAAWFYGSADRWAHHNDGADAGVFARDTVVPNANSRYSMKLTGAANIVGTNLNTRLEYMDTAPLRKANAFTVSGWARASTAGQTIAMMMLLSNVKDSFAWPYHSFGLGTSATISGNGTIAASGSMTLTTANTWYYFTVTNNNPNSVTATNGNFSNGFSLQLSIPTLNASSKTVNLSQFKLEPGLVATEFVPKTFAEEVRDCQRYCCKFGASDSTNPTSSLGAGTQYNTNATNLMMSLPQPMRTQPSATTSSGNWLSTYIGYGGTSISAAPSISDGNNGEYPTSRVRLYLANNGTGSSQGMGSWNQTLANKHITFSSEL